MSGYILTNEVHYVYDGMRVIQERSSANTPTVSYTRGSDLSGSLEGAGGIGGLLARSHGYSSGNWTTHNHYHADGNGNITYMVDASQAMAATYRYDPFGNTISSSGTLASANLYRFSSKENQGNSGLYYYGYRFYDPNLQRWPNRDPIEELGFPALAHRHRVSSANSESNLYIFVGNDPIRFVDEFGLAYGNPIPPCAPYPECLTLRPKPPKPPKPSKPPCKYPGECELYCFAGCSVAVGALCATACAPVCTPGPQALGCFACLAACNTAAGSACNAACVKKFCN